MSSATDGGRCDPDMLKRRESIGRFPFEQKAKLERLQNEGIPVCTECLEQACICGAQIFEVIVSLVPTQQQQPQQEPSPINTSQAVISQAAAHALLHSTPRPTPAAPLPEPTANYVTPHGATVHMPSRPQRLSQLCLRLYTAYDAWVFDAC